MSKINSVKTCENTSTSLSEFFISLSNGMVKSVLPKIRLFCLSRHCSKSDGRRGNCHDTRYRDRERFLRENGGFAPQALSAQNITKSLCRSPLFLGLDGSSETLFFMSFLYEKIAGRHTLFEPLSYKIR